MTDIEIQDIVARTNRALAETEKFFAESRKLRAEAGKFQREQITVLVTAAAALLGAGAVMGGLAVRLISGH